MDRCLLLICLAFFLVPRAEAQSLRGSRISVERIHKQALRHDLYFYQSASGVRRAAAAGRLLPLKSNRDYKVEGASYPYVLPATHTFVTRLAKQYRAACGERLVVTSAVRPLAFRLANGSDKTVHPTGMAVDLRKPSRPRCLNWLRRTLLELEDAGVLDAVEEKRPPHLHVAVFPSQYQQHVRRMGGSVRVAAAEDALPTAAESKAKPASKPAAKAPAKAAAATKYRVRRGDSLWGIARRHGTTVERLKEANDMSSSRISAGQTIVIPDAR